MSDYSLRESEKYFNRLEGVLNSKLFGGNYRFEAKNSEEAYAERSAKYFEELTLENNVFAELVDSGISYVMDLLDERGDEFDLGEDVDELDREGFIRLCEPVTIVFEPSEVLVEAFDLPIAFSIKMHLRAVPDELFEMAMTEHRAIYVGEYRGVSPWNDKLLKKKWNYIGK